MTRESLVTLGTSLGSHLSERSMANPEEKLFVPITETLLVFNTVHLEKWAGSQTSV